MEGDLISREAVLKLLYSIKDDDTVPKNYRIILDLIRKVRKIPTAFDVDKTIDNIRNIPHGYYNVETENEIVDIIRGTYEITERRRCSKSC